jgi:Flp pilus assembly protein TadG
MRRRLLQRGGTLVEGALTLLALFIFLFAIMEFGRAYNIYQTLTNAAREGARFAVAPCPSLGASGCPYGAGNPPTIGDIQNRVQLYLDSAKITGATVSVDQAVNGSINGTPTVFTNVNVQAPYSFIFFPFGSITLRTQAVMRNENN